MTTREIAVDYLRKARVRRRALQVLLDASSYDDVIREAQEIVELILKGWLRFVGVDPPKRHDIGDAVVQHAGRFPAEWRERLSEIEEISRELTDERGLAFMAMSRAPARPENCLLWRTPRKPAAGWMISLPFSIDSSPPQPSRQARIQHRDRPHRTLDPTAPSHPANPRRPLEPEP